STTSYSSLFLFYSYGAHRDLHSSPTRRSSDLGHGLRQRHQVEAARVDVVAMLGMQSRGQCLRLLPGLLQIAGLAKQRQHLPVVRSEEHTSELQSRENLVCRLLLEKKK